MHTKVRYLGTVPKRGLNPQDVLHIGGSNHSSALVKYSTEILVNPIYQRAVAIMKRLGKRTVRYLPHYGTETKAMFLGKRYGVRE